MATAFRRSIEFEFLPNPDGVFIHTRSGLPVCQFEADGQTHRGRPMIAAFAPTESGWRSMQELVDCPRASIFARLTNNYRLHLSFGVPK